MANGAARQAATRSRVMAKFMSGTLPAAIPMSSDYRWPRRAFCSKAQDTRLPEWLIERGIGETRAVLADRGEIIGVRIELDGVTPAGSVLSARLANTGNSGRNAVAVASDGVEYLL